MLKSLSKSCLMLRFRAFMISFEIMSKDEAFPVLRLRIAVSSSSIVKGLLSVADGSVEFAIRSASCNKASFVS